MRQFDVFNGDADGICALHQLRLAQPQAAELVTGVKRDVLLLDRVLAAAGDRITVLDISLHSNRADVLRLLQAGAVLEYFDHHHAGEIPQHPGLHAHINTDAAVCTSLLVDQYLGGAYHLWAIAAAFGDNLQDGARALADRAKLSATQIATLAHVGECLNYNGYGDSLEDLHFHPAALYTELKPYANPLVFAHESKAFARLATGFANDIALTDTTKPWHASDAGAVFVLPDAAWSRRVSGVYANRLATARPARAHAVLTPNSSGCYTVSVRAPISRPHGADVLCLRFPSGGGRTGAAGINQLPVAQLDAFVTCFEEQFLHA
ncbi:acetyltransferase [Curvibacter sp. CHRR-16]|uniref:acetyltransferase n=1 Tax=Curvibacter sp. CHRR-16 TaxID=2835872 RepID=UPI001BD9A062|nr:acetyltransferase [Curvibacter sp. CHRR-16]MBT0569325.1 acetyltransferase [Curvibacter sp. CHRR-16]